MPHVIESTYPFSHLNTDALFLAVNTRWLDTSSGKRSTPPDTHEAMARELARRERASYPLNAVTV